MSFEEECHENSEQHPAPFWQKFVHICPQPDQLHLVDGLRQLCPWIEQAFDGYTVEDGSLNDAARDYLVRHNIPYDTVVIPRDVD